MAFTEFTVLFYPDYEVMVDVAEDGTVIDLYTYTRDAKDFFGERGASFSIRGNPLFAHLDGNPETFIRQTGVHKSTELWLDDDSGEFDRATYQNMYQKLFTK